MFKDEAKGNRLRRLSNLLGLLFNLSLALMIVSSLLFIIALILEPVLMIFLTIVTLGTIWLLGGPPDFGPFLEGILPVIKISLILSVALFVVRFVTEWLFVLAESRSLKKNPQENAPLIEISAVVKRVKIADIIVFALVILSIALMAMITNVTGVSDAEAVGGGQKALPVICLIILIALPIAGRIYARAQFKKVDGAIAAVMNMRGKKY